VWVILSTKHRHHFMKMFFDGPMSNVLYHRRLNIPGENCSPGTDALRQPTTEPSLSCSDIRHGAPKARF
jgi:hypothetical protein